MKVVTTPDSLVVNLSTLFSLCHEQLQSILRKDRAGETPSTGICSGRTEPEHQCTRLGSQIFGKSLPFTENVEFTNYSKKFTEYSLKFTEYSET